MAAEEVETPLMLDTNPVHTAPADIGIFVAGKQWPWKVQHPGGRREIDEAHVPVGRIVRFVITSQDVVHSFFALAFRIERDAVPGTYTAV